MVKRTLLFLSLILGFSILQLAGQNNKFEREWNIGVGFGPTFSSISFDPAVSTSNLRQYMGGIAVRYLSDKNLGLIGEINYSQQGWESKFQDNPEYEHSHKLNYIEVPLLTHIYFGNKVRFFINIGPKFSFLLSESETINKTFSEHLASGGVNATFPTAHYYRMADRKFDYAIMAGLGLEFRTGIGNFALEGRYTFALSDIYKNSKSDYFTRSANRVVGAKLTYYVHLF